MDTERIVELILQELKNAGAAEVAHEEAARHAALTEVPASEPGFAKDTDAGNSEGTADGLMLDARPCPDVARTDKLFVGGQTRAQKLRQMQQATSARIGVGKSGARLRTSTVLQLRVDHAAARDSVNKDVSQALLDKMDLFSVDTLCKNQDEYLTRPDLGRKLSEEALATIAKRCKKDVDVQIYAAGGLSSTAIEANLANILPAILDGLAERHLTVGTPFYARYARVPLMDPISELLHPKVICVLIGERPGLATAESMSAYIAYQATVGMPESRRTVVSNIHRGGIAAAEAGAYIAGLIERMIEQKASGVAFAR